MNELKTLILVIEEMERKAKACAESMGTNTVQKSNSPLPNSSEDYYRGRLDSYTQILLGIKDLIKASDLG